MPIDISKVERAKNDPVYAGPFNDGYDVGYEEGGNSALADLFSAVTEETDIEIEEGISLIPAVVAYIKKLEADVSPKRAPCPTCGEPAVAGSGGGGAAPKEGCKNGHWWITSTGGGQHGKTSEAES